MYNLGLAIVLLVAPLASAGEVKPRKLFPKPTRKQMTDRQSTEFALLKFVDGAGVRLRGGRLIVDPQRVNGRLARTGIASNQVAARVAQVNEILARHQARVKPTFSLGEAKLDESRAAAEKASGREHADRTLFFLLTFRQPDDAMLDALEELNGLDIVEQAAPKGRVTLPDPTPSYVPDQDYLYSAPGGINASQMHLITGGLAAGIQIADVEYGWRTTHEDLPTPASVQNNSTDQTSIDHGTAVLGELVGLGNGYGV
ncbi:MAG TPA: hypothetical protein VF608_02175, partial [Thermoanaerobaculia bacterium]